MPRSCVLLADDSATVRALARLVLEEAGYAVVEAADGSEALKAAASRPPDVVLLDIEMPVMDGYETVAALKADPKTRDVPVVFLTGRVEPGDVARALQLGGHDYLRKPTDPEELLARVAAALRVKQLQDELRDSAAEFDRMSRTDYLTGLPNRRDMEEHLVALGAGGKRHGYPVAALLVDVDLFKNVNDTLGHETGDVVLREVATRLRDTMRAEDVLGRWGGEEFLALLPHTCADEAQVLGERLRKAVGEAPFEEGHSVTVSVGGASGRGVAGHELLRLADEQLYAAKQAGRDRVLVTCSPSATSG